jgi:DNA-binding NarL/FixJ family response regulator
MTKIRTILFDDSKKFQKELTEFFDASDKVFLTACFNNAEQAVKQVRDYKPDVVIMDIEMPVISGIEALQAIKKILPATKVLLLTGIEADDKIFAALCFGASGYALKTDEEGIERAIEDVEKGGAYFSPSVAARIARLFQNHFVRSQAHYVALTEKETIVLTDMVDGLKSKAIAQKRLMAFDTVRGHVKEIFIKLHVNSAQEAVREAILRGIV